MNYTLTADTDITKETRPIEQTSTNNKDLEKVRLISS